MAGRQDGGCMMQDGVLPAACKYALSMAFVLIFLLLALRVPLTVVVTFSLLWLKIDMKLFANSRRAEGVLAINTLRFVFILPHTCKPLGPSVCPAVFARAIVASCLVFVLAFMGF